MRRIAGGMVVAILFAVACGTPSYRITMQCDIPLEALKARGRFEVRSPVTNYPDSQSCGKTVEIELLHFDRDVETRTEAMALLEARGYRPVTEAELLVLAATYPELNHAVAVGALPPGYDDTEAWHFRGYLPGGNDVSIVMSLGFMAGTRFAAVRK